MAGNQTESTPDFSRRGITFAIADGLNTVERRASPTFIGLLWSLKVKGVESMSKSRRERLAQLTETWTGGSSPHMGADRSGQAHRERTLHNFDYEARHGPSGIGKYTVTGAPLRLELAKQFSDARYISLETFRKNGVAVRTTVWLVEDGCVLYFRTNPESGKAKRIRLNPHVRVARSDMGGNAKGDWVDGEARQVDEKESDRVRDLFRKKYGLQIRLLGGLSRFSGGRRDDSFVVGIRLADA